MRINPLVIVALSMATIIMNASGLAIPYFVISTQGQFTAEGLPLLDQNVEYIGGVTKVTYTITQIENMTGWQVDIYVNSSKFLNLTVPPDNIYGAKFVQVSSKHDNTSVWITAVYFSGVGGGYNGTLEGILGIAFFSGMVSPLINVRDGQTVLTGVDADRNVIKLPFTTHEEDTY